MGHSFCYTFDAAEKDNIRYVKVEWFIAWLKLRPTWQLGQNMLKEWSSRCAKPYLQWNDAQEVNVKGHVTTSNTPDSILVVASHGSNGR